MLEQEQHSVQQTPYEVLLTYLQSTGGHESLGDIIEGAQIVHTVMDAVDGATSNILMTMDLAEEVNSPLPSGPTLHVVLQVRLVSHQP